MWAQTAIFTISNMSVVLTMACLYRNKVSSSAAGVVVEPRKKIHHSILRMLPTFGSNPCLSESPVTSTARSLLPAHPSAPRETLRQNRDLRCSSYASVGRLTAPGISHVVNPRTFTDPNRSLPFPQSFNPNSSALKKTGPCFYFWFQA